MSSNALPPGNWRIDPFTKVLRFHADPDRVDEKTGLQPCGTPAAEARHRSNGEPVCEECRIAVRDYKRARRRAQAYRNAA